MIALNLPDQDLAKFRLICLSTLEAVEGDQCRLWFYRFHDTFDTPRICTVNHAETKAIYQYRRKLLNRGVKFKYGHTENEQVALRIIRDLILDALPVPDEFGVPHSRNITALKDFIHNTNILDCILERVVPQVKPTDNLLTIIQLVLSSQALQIGCNQIYAFDESQRMAYLPVTNAPIFSGFNGMTVNVQWALNMVNFFRYHMLREDETTLFNAYSDMTSESNGLLTPQFWKSRLLNIDNETPIGKHWHGTYAYLDRGEVQKLRHGKQNIYMDKNIDMGRKAIQSLTIEFPEVAAYAWPQIFEDHLESISFLKNQNIPPRTRSQRRSSAPGVTRPIGMTRRFEGKGYDDEEFYGAGWINPLPEQDGIPGFKRMTMMKFFRDQNGFVDVDALWAYEGIVLPGGQIIVGRWWSPEENTPHARATMYSGPFILWNTDCEHKANELENGELEGELGAELDT